MTTTNGFTGLETQAGGRFAALLQTYNREVERHVVKDSDTWLAAETMWGQGLHTEALAHIVRMIPQPTDRRALKKVLRHSRLRKCVKGLCEVPALAPLFESKYIWPMLQRGGCMVVSLCCNTCHRSALLKGRTDLGRNLRGDPGNVRRPAEGPSEKRADGRLAVDRQQVRRPAVERKRSDDTDDREGLVRRPSKWTMGRVMQGRRGTGFRDTLDGAQRRRKEF